MGISDWHYETSNGSTISDPGSGIYLWNHNTELSSLRKWYFYKNHIIGEYEHLTNNKYVTGYFILNELNGNLKTYDDTNLFENDLKNQQLTPQFWTRWYSDHYEVIQLIYILLWVFWMFYAPIAITVILFICLSIFIAFRTKNKTVKAIFIIIPSIIVVPLLLFILNDYCISSI